MKNLVITAFSQSIRSDVIPIVRNLVLGEINDSQHESWWRAIEVLEKGSEKPRMQMVDVILPTTGGLELRLPRYTEPSKEIALLLMRLKLKLPPQPRPELLNNHQAADTASQAFQAPLEKLAM